MAGQAGSISRERNKSVGVALSQTRVSPLFFPTAFFLLILISWSFCFGLFSAANIGFPRHSLGNHNAWNYFLPVFKYSFDRLKQGQLPLWNPYESCGLPALAVLQGAVFYPPAWLYCFVDVYTGLKWLTIFHLFWAGLWIYLLYRELFSVRSSELGSILEASLCATSFILSGFLTNQVWYPGNLYTAVWAPCLLFLGERLVKERRWKWVVCLALAGASMLLAGFPQFATYIFLFLAAYMTFRIFQLYSPFHRKRQFLQAFWLSIFAVILIVFLTAPQLLPTYELMFLSGRKPGALMFHSLLFLCPSIYSLKALLQANLHAFPLHYLNLFLVAGAFVSFADAKRRPLVLFFASAGVLSLILSLGPNTALFKYYFLHVPTGNWFGTPSRWRLISFLSLSILGARGIALLLGEPDARMVSKKVHFQKAAFLAAGVVVVLAGFTYAGGFQEILSLDLMNHLSPSYLFPFELGALLGAIYLLRKGYLSEAVLYLVVILFFFLEFLSIMRFAEPFPSAKRAQYNQDAVRFLKEHQGYQRAHLENRGLAARVFPEKSASMFRFHATTGWDPLSLSRYRSLIRAAQGNPPFPVGENYGYFQISDSKMTFSIFNLLSPKFIVVSDGANDLFDSDRDEPFTWTSHFPRVQFPLAAEFDGVKIYENPSALPRALLSRKFTVCTDDEKTLKMMMGPEFDPAIRPIINEVPDLNENERPVASGKQPEMVKIELLDDERMVCRVESNSPGIFWTTDIFYPGWRVKVNGKESRLLRVNYAFRGVALPAGLSHVEFTYRCRPFITGLFLFTLGILIIITGILIQHRNPIKAQGLMEKV